MLIILGFVTYFNHVFVPAPFAALALEKSPIHSAYTAIAAAAVALALRDLCAVPGPYRVPHTPQHLQPQHTTFNAPYTYINTSLIRTYWSASSTGYQP